MQGEAARFRDVLTRDAILAAELDRRVARRRADGLPHGLAVAYAPSGGRGWSVGSDPWRRSSTTLGRVATMCTRVPPPA